MKDQRIIGLMSTLLLIGIWTNSSYSQSSNNYTIEWDVIDNGGGESLSPEYMTIFSIGQISDGNESISDSYTEHAGWYPVNEIEAEPTPMPTAIPINPTPIVSTVPEPSTLLLFIRRIIGRNTVV